MKQVLLDLLGKVNQFIQSLSQKTAAGSASDDTVQPQRSLASSTLNLQAKRNAEEPVEAVAEVVETVTEPELQEEPAAVIETAEAEALVAEPVAVVEAVAPATEPEPEVAEPEPAVSVIAEPVAVAEVVVTPAAVTVATVSAKSAIPEDVVLRRHYLTQRKAEILASLPAQPSDSTLKRHYQQLLDAKLAEIAA